MRGVTVKGYLSSILSFLLGALLVGPLAAAPAAAATGDCSETATWGSAWVDAEPDWVGSLITDLRAGRHACYDRLVIDLNRATSQPASVGYVDEVLRGPTENVLPLRGGAKLWVFVHAGIGRPDNPTYNPPDWNEAVDVTGFETFRQVGLGGTFEGDTDIGLGVRERLPFRVFMLDDPGEGSRLVIDVAHSWQGQGSPSASPFGNYERASGVTGGVEVAGWAIDPDTTDPIYVWVTVDGVGRHLYASGNRPDVAAVYPAYGASHGFRGIVAAADGSHRVCVTASNVRLGGHTPLGCRTVTVPRSSPFGNYGRHTPFGCRTVTVPDRSPFGNYEESRGSTGGIEVKGWAIDPDTTDPIYVWVTIDGVGRHLYANVSRPDVGAAYPAFGPNHGFSATLVTSPGEHRVCVTASNVGPGSHTGLGCRTVTAEAG